MTAAAGQSRPFDGSTMEKVIVVFEIPNLQNKRWKKKLCQKPVSYLQEKFKTISLINEAQNRIPKHKMSSEDKP